MPEGFLPAFSCLQRKVFFVIFCEIQSFLLGWNSLCGVVPESAAPIVRLLQSFLGAKDLTIFQLGAVETVDTGSIDFLAKQHMVHLSFQICDDYTPTEAGNLLLFRGFPRRHSTNMKNTGINAPNCPRKHRLYSRENNPCRSFPPM